MSVAEMLNEDHFQEVIVDSAVDPAVAEERGYRTLTGTADDRAFLEDLGYSRSVWDRDDAYPMLLLPMRGADGETNGHQVKPAVPRGKVNRERQHKPIKYETPKGAPLVVDMPPRSLAKLRAEAGAAVWLTEGMKKVDALVSAGAAAFGITGVFNWRAKDGALGDWEDVPLKGRPAVVCFDADANSNRLVQLAMGRLGAWLKSRGSTTVYYVVVPAEVDGTATKGADDYLAAGGTLQGLFDVATQQAPGSGGPDASFTDAYLVEAACEGALDSRFCWASGLGWLKWDGRVWTEVADTEPVEAVRLWALEQFEASIAKQKDNQSLAGMQAQVQGWRGVLTKSRLRALVDLSRGIIERYAADFDDDPDLLTVLNGTLHLPTGTLRPHDPADFITVMAGAEYHPGKRHPLWDKALTALPAEVRPWYQDRMGQAISGHPVPDHVLVLSYGMGSNGKSTVVDVVNSTLGKYGVLISDRVLLAGPTDHPTELMDLRGARYAVMEETPEARQLNIHRLKKTVGTPEITARKIRHDDVTFRATHSLFMNSNYKPTINETDHGTWRRLALLTFPYTFRKQHEKLTGPLDRPGDPDLQYAVESSDVKAACLAWMVEGCVAWYQRGRRMLPTPALVEEDTRMWRAENDLIIGFADECLVLRPDSFTAAADVLAEFNRWGMERGHRPWNDKTFASRFGGHDVIRAAKVTNGRKYTDGRQVRGWHGVEIRKGDDGGDPFGFEPDPEPLPYPANNSEQLPDQEELRDNSFVGFDLETLSADKLFTAEPGAFIKLVGVGSKVLHARDVDVVPDHAPLVGCNSAFFDALALDRHAGIPVENTLIGGRDLRIAAFQHDPPTSYETDPGPGFKSYSLDALGERYLNVPKSTLGKELVKEYGGWDHIPADDPRYVEYCRDDVALTEQLDKAIPWDPYEEREMRVSAITARATLTGFKVDVDGLTERAQSLAARSDAGRTMLAEKFGFPLTDAKGQPAKAPQRSKLGKAAFLAALTDAGFPVDRWPTGKDGTLSLSKDTMAHALAHAEKNCSPAADVIRAVSEMNGIRNNAANVLRCVTPDGRVHPAFLPFQATGRWSILEPGLTVLKKGTEDSERAFLIADDDEDLVSIDLDQIDMRCVGAHSQDENLLAILNDPTRDIHSEISKLAFGDAEGKHRHFAKSLDLGWLYGRGIKGMVENTPGVTMEAAQRVDGSMRGQFTRVLEWQTEVRQLGEAGVLLDNGFGRRLRVDPDRAYTQAPAMMGQSTTRDLIAEGLLDLARQAPDVLRMLRVIVHDEVVLSVPRKDREEIARLVQSCMSREWAPAGKSRPVRISAGQGKPFVFGQRWSELYL